MLQMQLRRHRMLKDTDQIRCLAAGLALAVKFTRREL